MGKYLVHLNHVRDVYEKYQFTEHGLLSTDIDKQNWRSAQRLTFSQVRTLMADLGNFSNCGTRTYLKMVWMYVEIFHSEVASLYTRIVYASAVITFLGVWKNWVKISPRLKAADNFISTQTYVDIIVSCHSDISLICFMRDNFPTPECNLTEVMTGCCETTFSSLEQWVGNHHNYTMLDMRRNRFHQIRLEQLRADPEGPKFATSHPKGESIWERQYESPFVKADLKDYPGRGSEIDAYKLGIMGGREMVVEVRMCPKDYVVSDNVFPPISPGDKYSSALWFYQPFSYIGNYLRPSLDLDAELIADDEVGDNADNLETTPPTPTWQRLQKAGAIELAKKERVVCYDDSLHTLRRRYHWSRNAFQNVQYNFSDRGIL